jgi:hypothetical protein
MPPHMADPVVATGSILAGIKHGRSARSKRAEGTVGAARYLNSASGTSVIAGMYVISISMTT